MIKKSALYKIIFFSFFFYFVKSDCENYLLKKYSGPFSLIEPVEVNEEYIECSKITPLTCCNEVI